MPALNESRAEEAELPPIAPRFGNREAAISNSFVVVECVAWAKIAG